MPRRVIIKRKRRSRKKRSRSPSKHRISALKLAEVEAEGVLGSSIMAPGGPTSTMEFIRLVKVTFGGESDSYRNFVRIMTALQDESRETIDVISELIVLFDGYPHLIQNFNRFLPPMYSLEIQADAVVVKVYEDCEEGEEDAAQAQEEPKDGKKKEIHNYIHQIKQAFPDDEDVYPRFTNILKDYHKKKISEVETVRKVVSLFRRQPFLVLHFNQFLPDGYQIHMFEESSYTIEYPSKHGKKAVAIRV